MCCRPTWKQLPRMKICLINAEIDDCLAFLPYLARWLENLKTFSAQWSSLKALCNPLWTLRHGSAGITYHYVQPHRHRHELHTSQAPSLNFLAAGSRYTSGDASSHALDIPCPSLHGKCYVKWSSLARCGPLLPPLCIRRLRSSRHKGA